MRIILIRIKKNPFTFGKEEEKAIALPPQWKRREKVLHQMGFYPGPQPGPYLGEGRLQHVTEDAELFEVPCLVSQVFDDWVGRKVLPEL